MKYNRILRSNKNSFKSMITQDQTHLRRLMEYDIIIDEDLKDLKRDI